MIGDLKGVQRVKRLRTIDLYVKKLEDFRSCKVHIL